MKHDKTPFYIQIQDHFKNLILTHQLVENDKIPSEKELMEQFDVSRIVVANALKQMANDGWIYRIPGRGSFVRGIQQGLMQHNPIDSQKQDTEEEKVDRTDPPPKSARQMVGFIIPYMEDLFAIRLLQGINEILKNSDYYFVIMLSNNSISKEKEAIRELIHKGAVGLIIFPVDAELYNEEILALKVKNYPFVIVDRYLPGIETHLVCSDNVLGAQLAVNHLWELGHRQIAICSDSPLPTVTVEDRISGYMEVLKQKGTLINPELILTECKVDYAQINPQLPLYRFIKSQMATAYIALNAKLGVSITSIAKQLGLRVPDDISILTFDDPSSGFNEFETYTHIAQSEHEMGIQSAKILLKIVEENSTRPTAAYNKVVLRPELVVKQTTGPANINH